MRPFLLSLAIVTCWIGVTVHLCRIANRGEPDSLKGDSGVQNLGLVLTICTICAVLMVTCVLPSALRVDVTGALRWIHHVGVVLLGTFLAAALYLQLEIRLKLFRDYPLSSVCRSIRHWRELTELLPAPAAIMILGTGMGLVYAIPGYSIRRGWIFTLIVALAVMMADGIFGYTNDVRRLYQAAELGVKQATNRKEFLRVTKNGWRDAKMLLHSLSFPIVIVFPAARICNGKSPAGPLLARAGVMDKPGWMQLWPALVLFIIPFFAVAALNRFGRRAPIEARD